MVDGLRRLVQMEMMHFVLTGYEELFTRKILFHLYLLMVFKTSPS